MTKFEFDTGRAIKAAWALCWADNLRQRAAGSDFRGSSYHLTAADLETQVRAFAEDTLAGRPWRTERAFGGYGFSVRFRGDLQGLVRRWLATEANMGNLECHNFGRGHISGMRYRPRGEPLYSAEARTIREKAERRANPRPTPKHMRRGSGPLCTAARRHGFGRSTAWTVHLWKDVTCAQCLNLRPTEAPVPACEAV